MAAPVRPLEHSSLAPPAVLAGVQRAVDQLQERARELYAALACGDLAALMLAIPPYEEASAGLERAQHRWLLCLGGQSLAQLLERLSADEAAMARSGIADIRDSISRLRAEQDRMASLLNGNARLNAELLDFLLRIVRSATDGYTAGRAPSSLPRIGAVPLAHNLLDGRA